jgi:hypothetical protein
MTTFMTKHLQYVLPTEHNLLHTIKLPKHSLQELNGVDTAGRKVEWLFSLLKNLLGPISRKMP